MIDTTMRSGQDSVTSVAPSPPPASGAAAPLASVLPAAAPGGRAGALTAQRLLDAHYYLTLARALDDRMWVLNRQGKAPFVISCCGHEAAQVGSALALQPGVDWVLPYYRDLGVLLVLGMTAREAMLQFLARADDPCSGGRQMPGHWSYPKL